MPVSYHFRVCKAPLSRNVNGAICELSLPFLYVAGVLEQVQLCVREYGSRPAVIRIGQTTIEKIAIQMRVYKVFNRMASTASGPLGSAGCASLRRFYMLLSMVRKDSWFPAPEQDATSRDKRHQRFVAEDGLLPTLCASKLP